MDRRYAISLGFTGALGCARPSSNSMYSGNLMWDGPLEVKLGDSVLTYDLVRARSNVGNGLLEGTWHTDMPQNTEFELLEINMRDASYRLSGFQSRAGMHLLKNVSIDQHDPELSARIGRWHADSVQTMDGELYIPPEEGALPLDQQALRRAWELTHPLIWEYIETHKK